MYLTQQTPSIQRPSQITATIDKPLLSSECLRALNPLSLTISAAKFLPSSPVPYTELDIKCNPPTLSFEFPGEPRQVGYSL